MAGRRAHGRYVCPFPVVVLACIASAVAGAQLVRADSPGRCLSPDVGHALESVVKAGTLDGILGKDFTLERVDIRANTIELEIHDHTDRAYGATLALSGSQQREPDGHGRQFDFVLDTPRPASPQAADALLRAAAAFDAAIPAAAVVECDVQPRPSPRALAPAIVVAEIALVLIAVLLGVRAMARIGRSVATADRAPDPHPSGVRSPHAGTAARQRMSYATAVGLVFLGLLVGLVATETVLRCTVPSLDFHFPTARVTNEQFVKRAGRTMDANGVHYAFDADGFRTTSAPSPAADAPTILFIGDSFTQGFGVEADQTFPAQTCERLARDGVQARCLNAGVTGFGTAHELRLLQTLLADKGLRVDAVVFQVLPNNDLHDNWEDGGFGVENGRLVAYDAPRIPRTVQVRQAICDGPIGRNSQIVKVVANAWIGSEGIDPHYDTAAFELERRLLQQVVAATQQRHIPIIIAVCATGWELDAVKSQPYDDRARLDFVSGVVAALGVPWIDSRQIAGTPDDYIRSDGHFSPAGNMHMAHALAEQLEPMLGR